MDVRELIDDKPMLLTIPEEQITYDMCFSDVSKHRNVLYLVPLKFRTRELCLLAINESDYLNYEKTIKEIPREIFDKDFALQIISKKPYYELLKLIPKELITEEIVLLVLKNSVNALNFARPEFFTNDFILKSIQLDKRSLKHIPNSYVSKETCIYAVSKTPSMLKYIPKILIDYDICRIAVQKDWKQIRNVPEKYIDKELSDMAFKINIKALKYIPSRFKSIEQYTLAIKKYPDIIVDCPDILLDEKNCLSLIERNWKVIMYLSEDKKTSLVCQAAIKKCTDAIAYIPQQFFSEEICLSAISNNSLLFTVLPDVYKTSKVCSAALKKDLNYIKYVPNCRKDIDLYLDVLSDINFSKVFLSLLKEHNWFFRKHGGEESGEFYYFSDSFGKYYNCGYLDTETKQILIIDYNKFREVRTFILSFEDLFIRSKECITIERKKALRKVLESEYDKNNRLFHVTESLLDKKINNTFKSFKKYYDYLDGNLINADLTEYDFSNNEISRYDLSKANLNSSTLIKLGKYDDTFYNNMISSYSSELSIITEQNNEIIEAISLPHPYDLSNGLNTEKRKIFYITDIHINHKLLKEFPCAASYAEIVWYIRKIVKTLVNSFEHGYNDYLLIGGDVSFCFEISKIFYSELAKKWEPQKIVCVLGNHELWDFNRFGGKQKSIVKLDRIVDKYRQMFAELNITFLHNSLLFLSKNKYNFEQLHVIPENDLLNKDLFDIIKENIVSSSLVILGGLGFSGYNAVYNAGFGLYRNTLVSLEDDKYQTKRFETVYNNVSKLIPLSKLIVLTHTQKEDWTNSPYNENYIYIYGHTHKNEYCISKEKTIFADNQIGYKSTQYCLKFFELSLDYDIFKYYEDGIYKISKEQYFKFNYGKNLTIKFSRDCEYIIMLKKKGYYCFIVEDNKRLYLLDGGRIRKLSFNNLDYYYENMSLYGDTINLGLHSYNKVLIDISNAVKSIGGDGKIHGCIVDIDFLNHIYLDPVDGSIKPYYSPYYGYQKFFRDVPALLSKMCPAIYKNYVNLIANYNTSLITSDYLSNNITLSIFSTTQYKPSNLINNLQYITEKNIIRVWNDKFISGQKTEFIDEIKLLEKNNK